MAESWATFHQRHGSDPNNHNNSSRHHHHPHYKNNTIIYGSYTTDPRQYESDVNKCSSWTLLGRVVSCLGYLVGAGGCGGGGVGRGGRRIEGE